MSEIDVLCWFFWKPIRKFHGVFKTNPTADAAFLDEACVVFIGFKAYREGAVSTTGASRLCP